MGIQLRPYQVECIEAVKRDWQTYSDVLLTVATGGGKTAIFLALIVEMLSNAPKSRALIISHRQELVFQPIERLCQFWPEWGDRAGAVMAEHDECNLQIVSATVQTLASARRLQRLLAYGPIDYLVVDETHHSCAASYRTVLDTLRDINPDLRHLGVTATPMRADGHGLVEVYQHESAHYGIRELVRSGYLVPPRWLAIQTGISLKGVTTHDGDFTAKRLADVYETSNCFDLVVESHRRYADGRQCLAFTASVDGAYDLAETFRGAGITAAAADATTDRDERRRLLRDFSAGRVQVLCNMGLFTEGLDVPAVSCIHQVRPTKSDALYTQIIGRALRTSPGKQDALIMDYCPLEARNVVMMGDVLGVDARKDVYVSDDPQEGAVVGGFTFDGQTHWLSGNPMEIVSRQLDYLNVSPWSWYRAPDGWMSIGLGQADDKVERSLVMSPPGEEMTLYLVARRDGERANRAYQVRTGSLADLSEWAEEYIARRGQASLAAKARNWRSEPASEKQIKFARRLGIKDFPSKGAVAEQITHLMSVRAVGRIA